VTGGLRAATTDRLTIAAWWDRWPAANVAIRTGVPSGLVVIDVDPDHGGAASLDALVASHGPLPDGRRVRTGSGGHHYYLAHPGTSVRNDTGTRLGTGVDIRGDGGYVIAPPSRHASGATYTWEPGATTLPPVPAWMLEALRPPPRPDPPPLQAPGASTGLDAWARAALRDELALVRTAPQGRRNHTLNRSAFCLGQIVAGGGLHEPEVRAELLHAALAAGLGEREARRTIDSGLQAGCDIPRAPPPRRRPAGIDPVVDAAIDRALTAPRPASQPEPDIEVSLP
jgi:hypothetical protein